MVVLLEHGLTALQAGWLLAMLLLGQLLSARAASLEAPEEQGPGVQATLEVRRPDVQWSPAGAARWVSVPDRQAVGAGDRVRTGPGASALLRYTQGTVTEIGPETGLLVQRLEQGSDGNFVTGLLQTIGTTITRITGLDPQDAFELETPALIARPGGTVVGMQVGPDGATQVANLSEMAESVVLVHGKDPDRTQVLLRPGEGTSVLPGLPPAAPSPLPPALQQGLAAPARLGATQQPTSEQPERQERH
jgi:hypothetical protein